jgi:hypothetical protein
MIAEREEQRKKIAHRNQSEKRDHKTSRQGEDQTPTTD